MTYDPKSVALYETRNGDLYLELDGQICEAPGEDFASAASFLLQGGSTRWEDMTLDDIDGGRMATAHLVVEIAFDGGPNPRDRLPLIAGTPHEMTRQYAGYAPQDRLLESLADDIIEASDEREICEQLVKLWRKRGTDLEDIAEFCNELRSACITPASNHRAEPTQSPDCQTRNPA